MKQQKIVREKAKTPIIYERAKEENAPAPKTGDGIPVRTVIYVEVKDMSAAQIRSLLEQINASYQKALGGIHYILPVRHGRLSSDILFEKEILTFVNNICEVVDGEIVLKNGYSEVNVIRESV